MKITSEQFNEMYPEGTGVKYFPVIDRPEFVETKTRSQAWDLCGTPVVMIEGRAGGCALRNMEINQTEDTMENGKEITKEIAEQEQVIEQEKQVVAQIVAEAEAVVIKTEQENQVVANKIVGYREALKRIEEKVMSRPRETKRQATATVSELEALFVKPLEQALKLLRDKSAKFFAAEEARRAELQRKEDIKFDKAAARSEATGKPLTVAPKFIAKVQTEGVSYRTTYFAEVVDIKKLCAAIAAGTVDAEAVEPVLPFLNAKAKARKTAGDEIYPGVFCRSKKVVG